MSDSLARERVSMLLFYGTLGLLAYFVYRLFAPFLAPLAWAAVFAALFHPIHRRMEARWGKTTAAAVSTFLVTVTIVLPALLIMTVFVQEASQAISSVDLSTQTPAFARVQELWSRMQASLLGRRIGDLDDLITRTSAWTAGLIAGQAGALLRNLVIFIVDLVVMLFAVFFFFRDGETMMRTLRRAMPFRPDLRDLMIAQAGELIQASVFAGLVVAVIQGALGGVTFALLGLDAPVFWGVVMAFFALLPVGAGVIWGPAAVWLLLSGSVGRGVTLIVIGVGIIGLVDNFLRPALVSGRTQMNGLLIFISLLGGVAAFGLVGLILGPVVMATAIGLAEAYAIERREGHRPTDEEGRRA